MLLILYGASSELGRKCRDHLQNKGYELVENIATRKKNRFLNQDFGRECIYQKMNSMQKRILFLDIM